MKRLRLASLLLFIAGLASACSTTTDDVSPDPVITTASLTGDNLNTVTIDSVSRIITVQIGSYSSRNPYRPTSDRLSFAVPPQSFMVAQYDTSKLSKPLDLADGKPNTFVTHLDLLTYSNQNPLRLRVIRNGSAGTVVTVNSGGTTYTLQVKASSPLKLDGVLAQQGLWTDNADTVRLSTTNWRYYTITMGVSGLYNGTGPVTPTFSLVNVHTKEKTRVFAAGDLTTLYIYVNDLGNRLGTYQVLLETADGRKALSPFFIKIS